MSRKYTEDEVRRILTRAVEAEPGDVPRASDGLSLDEIKEIGAEVGIDTVRVERAARELERPTPSRGFRWIGAPLSQSVERRGEGELDPASTSEVLSLIRSGMGRPGDLSEVGRLLEWRASGELGERVVTLSSRDGVTTVTGLADLRNAAVVTFLPATMLGLVGSIIGFINAADSGSGFGMILALALLPALLLVARALFRHLGRSEWARLERVADDLVDLVERSHPPGRPH